MSGKKNIFLGVILLACLAYGCDSDKQTISASTIFASEVKDTVLEIIFYANNDGVIIKDKEDIDKIYDALSSLLLTKSKDQDSKDGGVVMEIIAEEVTIRFNITTISLSINGVSYDTDRDVLTEIRDIFEPYF